jgi:hypothetical protein
VSDLTANPQTFGIDGLTRRVFTAGEFARIDPPRCPVCGAKVTIERIDITANEEDEARNGRTYIAGMWECPHGCDPRTGERRHYEQKVSSGIDGLALECSCGFSQAYLTGTDLAALAAEHCPPGGKPVFVMRL